MGHRILPVYIFSLLGLSPNILFDRSQLHVSSPDHVLVLQTASSSIEVPFFDDDGCHRHTILSYQCIYRLTIPLCI